MTAPRLRYRPINGQDDEFERRYWATCRFYNPYPDPFSKGNGEMACLSYSHETEEGWAYINLSWFEDGTWVVYENRGNGSLLDTKKFTNRWEARREWMTRCVALRMGV